MDRVDGCIILYNPRGNHHSFEILKLFIFQLKEKFEVVTRFECKELCLKNLQTIGCIVATSFASLFIYFFISKNLVKGHFKSASNMTKPKRKTITKEKRNPRRAKKKQQKWNTVQIIEFLEAQSTTIKKRRGQHAKLNFGPRTLPWGTAMTYDATWIGRNYLEAYFNKNLLKQQYTEQIHSFPSEVFVLLGMQWRNRMG